MIGGTTPGLPRIFAIIGKSAGAPSSSWSTNQRRSDNTGFQAMHRQENWFTSARLGQACSGEFRALSDVGRNLPPLHASRAGSPAMGARSLRAGIQPWWHYVNAYHEIAGCTAHRSRMSSGMRSTKNIRATPANRDRRRLLFAAQPRLLRAGRSGADGESAQPAFCRRSRARKSRTSS